TDPHHRVLASFPTRRSSDLCNGTTQLINLPGALVDMQTNMSFDEGCGNEIFLNQGTVRKSGGTGTNSVNVVLNNTGLLDVQTGTVSRSEERRVGKEGRSRREGGAKKQ